MNGRTIFEKYNKVINILIRVFMKMPHCIRIWLYNVNQYKNTKLGMLIRYLVVSSFVKKMGKNVAIFPGVYFENLKNLSIGNNVSIHQMCYIDAEGGVEIGNDVSIAHRCTVLSSNHGYERNDIPIKYQEMKLERTIIDSNVWIGCGTTIMAGVEIGSGTVIGAGAVVTKNIPNDSVAVGCPAKVIKKRIKLSGEKK